jgi:hypothetical protein
MTLAEEAGLLALSLGPLALGALLEDDGPHGAVEYLLDVPVLQRRALHALPARESPLPQHARQLLALLLKVAIIININANIVVAVITSCESGRG